MEAGAVKASSQNVPRRNRLPGRTAVISARLRGTSAADHLKSVALAGVNLVILIAILVLP
jgi:hypothetical protein